MNLVGRVEVLVGSGFGFRKGVGPRQHRITRNSVVSVYPLFVSSEHLCAVWNTALSTEAAHPK